jgi:hypothetical protein
MRLMTLRPVPLNVYVASQWALLSVMLLVSTTRSLPREQSMRHMSRASSPLRFGNTGSEKATSSA